MIRTHAIVFVVGAALSGCTSLDKLDLGTDTGGADQDNGNDGTTATDPGTSSPDDTGLGDTGGPGDPPPPPITIFEENDLDDGGLTNVSRRLNDVLEGGSLDGACEQWRLDRTDRNLELRCGKWMFFYETFGTEGVPVGFVDLLLSGFEEQVGPGFSNYGLIPDPYSDRNYPLGMVEGPDGVAFTCASCHFAQLPDGRYSVGAANLDYAYGHHNLALGLFPLASTSALTGADVDPDAQAVIQPLLDRLASDLWLQLRLVGVLAGLIGSEIPLFTAEAQYEYSQWLPGTMDFFIEPLPIDDGVLTVSKISSLYSIPSTQEGREAGMEHAMLGWTGNTLTLENFVGQFDALGGGDGPTWSARELRPLATYIRTLHAPEPATVAPAETLDLGEQVFRDGGCLECHAGPRGSGLELFEFEEIGTDDAIGDWMDPDGDGEACCGLDMGEDAITHKIKAPRLVGLWAMKRFLHNGSVGSLDELLCVNGPREIDNRPVYGNGGHLFGCDTLTKEEKEAVIAYLDSH